MNAALVTALVFTCLMAGVWIGMRVSAALPDHHLASESKEVVRLGMGLIATMSALVLGLVIASAKSAFDSEAAAVRTSAVDVLLLDRILAEYGPGAQPPRELLRRAVEHVVEPTGSGSEDTGETDAAGLTLRSKLLEVKIRALAPEGDAQRELRARALDLVADLQRTRWLAYEVAEETIPTPFLVVLTFWLSVLFASFALFAPRNGTVVAALVLCALSVSGSIFLILEMSHPFAGVVKVSAEPLRFALEHLGK